MRQASECFVDLYELQDAVGRRIAELTRNEAAFVSGGAAAGMFLSAAVCMARDTDDGVLRPEAARRPPARVPHPAGHRIPYDPAIELAGGRLIEIGGPGGTSEADLVGAISPGTAGILYVAGAHLAAGTLPLEAVIDLARARDIPVIVDAAAQLPPVENLWRFTEAGADLVLFSGGKGLCGPASTGLVLGRRRYVERFAANAAPQQRIGRPMKVGKEDLIGDPGGGGVVPRSGSLCARPPVRGDRRARRRVGTRAARHQRGARDPGPGRAAHAACPAHPRAGTRIKA